MPREPRPPFVAVFRKDDFGHPRWSWASLEALVQEQAPGSLIYVFEGKQVLVWGSPRKSAKKPSGPAVAPRWTSFPKTAESLQKNIPVRWRAYLMPIQHVSKDLLDLLKGDPDARVRARVASATIPDAMLKVFAKDDSMLVRRSVAWNMSSSNSTLWLLRDDSDELIVEGLLRGSTDDALLRYLVKKHMRNPMYERALISVFGSEGIREGTIRLLSTHNSNKVRWFVARETKDDKLLEKMSKDPDTSVRKEVILNELTAPDVVERMMREDPSRAVRDAAKQKHKESGWGSP